MNQLESQTKDQPPLSEDLFRDELIDHMVILWAVAALIGFALVQLRSLEIGHTVRDIVLYILDFSMILTAFYRRKLSTRLKAHLIIIFNLIIGFIGVSTLGMLAGGIFFFPLNAVIIALFYSARVVTYFALLSIGFICFIAIGFTTNYLTLKTSAEFLLRNYAHWSVYILCLVVFFLISCVTILNYRRGMIKLINKVNQQRDELQRRNKDLQVTLDEIKTLRGIIPICAYCKGIRDDAGCWSRLEEYIESHSEAQFSHGICDKCMKEHFPGSGGK